MTNSIKLVSIFLYQCFSYKKGSIFLFSILLSGGVTTIEQITQIQLFGINLTFLILGIILILTDFMFGVVADRYQSKKKGIKIEDRKRIKYIDFTIYKIITLFILLWLTHEIGRQLFTNESNGNNILGGVVNTSMLVLQFCRTIMFSLICSREYISIGENIERRFEKKLYMFSIFEKLFDIIELKFIRRVADSKICEIEPQKIEANEKN